MVKIAPKRIAGTRHEGFALDYHTVSSVMVGYNTYGRPEFKTTYTPIGELLYRLKNNRDLSVVEEIAETAWDFVRKWGIVCSAIVPVPPSNMTRTVQPVAIVGERLASALKLDWLNSAIKKVRATPQLKDVLEAAKRAEILDGAVSVDSNLVEGRNVLLFDDLYRSGATMNEIAATLYDSGKAKHVYALALTRTRKNR
jgi:predicted amidophosphoribosyltransferase